MPALRSSHLRADAAAATSPTSALHTLVPAGRPVLRSLQGSGLRIALSIVYNSRALCRQSPQAGKLAGAHAIGRSQVWGRDTAADKARLKPSWSQAE